MFSLIAFSRAGGAADGCSLVGPAKSTSSLLDELSRMLLKKEKKLSGKAGKGKKKKKKVQKNGEAEAVAEASGGAGSAPDDEEDSMFSIEDVD